MIELGASTSPQRIFMMVASDTGNDGVRGALPWPPTTIPARQLHPHEHDWRAMNNPFNDNGKSERLGECVDCGEIRAVA